MHLLLFQVLSSFMGVNESNSRNISCKTTRYFNCFFFITLIVSQLLTNRHDINNFISNAAKVSFWLIYVYIPILFIIVWVKRKWKNQKHKQINTYFLYNILQSNGMFTKTLSMMYNLFKEPYLTLQKIIK